MTTKNVDAAVTREINGTEYGTRHMDPEKVLFHAGKVFSLMGGSVGSMSTEKGAAAIAMNMRDLGVMKLLNDCFDLAMVNGKELGKNDFWKVHFLGKQKDLVRLIAFVLEVHFFDFFGEMIGVASELKPRLFELLGSIGAQTPE